MTKYDDNTLARLQEMGRRWFDVAELTEVDGAALAALVTDARTLRAVLAAFDRYQAFPVPSRLEQLVVMLKMANE